MGWDPLGPILILPLTVIYCIHFTQTIKHYNLDPNIPTDLFLHHLPDSSGISTLLQASKSLLSNMLTSSLKLLVRI